MAKLSKDDWETIRARRETGVSFGMLAKEYNVSKTIIVTRSTREGWGDGSDTIEAIRRKATEKVTGVTTAQDTKKREEAIDLEAEKLAKVEKRHREEPDAIRERLYTGLKRHREAQTKEEKQLAFEDLKAAKIASETLLNIHKAERQAWGMDYQVDVRNMTDEQLDALSKGKMPRI